MTVRYKQAMDQKDKAQRQLLSDLTRMPDMRGDLEADNPFIRKALIVPGCRELLYLDLALENTVRAAAERGSGASGTGAAALMAPLLQNLVLSAGDNEELAYCLKAWQALPDTVKTGRYPAKDDALKVCLLLSC